MIALLLTALVFGFADPTEAELWYQAGRYERALVLFQEAFDQDQGDKGALLYNMGNCAYKLGRYAEAVWHYGRAFRRDPADEDTLANYRSALKQLGLPERRPSGHRISGQPGDHAGWVHARLWTCAVMQLIGLMGFVWFREPVRWIPGLVAVVGLALGVLALQRNWPPVAVVLNNEVLLRQEPHVSQQQTLKMQAGHFVLVEEASDRWVRITHDKVTGWVERSALGFID